MTVPPVVDLPDKCASSVVMSIQYVVAATESPFTLSEQTFKWSGARWKMDVTIPPIKESDLSDEYKSFFLRLQGIHGRFLIGDPTRKFPKGTASGNPVVNGGGQSGNLLATSGWTPNQPKALSVGDYIQIGTGLSAKYHMVVENVVVNSSGEAIINIEPALRMPPAHLQSVIVENPRGVFRTTSNEPAWSVSPGGIYRFGFSAHEVVSA